MPQDEPEYDENFNVSDTLTAYREAYNRGDKAKCQELKKAWKDWQGEDSLHEMVFGEP